MNKNKAIKWAKIGVGIVASMGVGAIVGNLIKISTPAGQSVVKKLLIGAGGLVLCGIAGDAATAYTDAQVDTVVEGIEFGQRLTQGTIIITPQEEETEA